MHDICACLLVQGLNVVLKLVTCTEMKLPWSPSIPAKAMAGQPRPVHAIQTNERIAAGDQVHCGKRHCDGRLPNFKQGFDMTI